MDEISGLTTTSDFQPVHRLLGATPEQLIETAQSRARSFGMENQQLLAQDEVLGHEVFGERKKELSRAGIEGARTSRNLDGMRPVLAGSEVIDSANVLSCGGTQLRFRTITSTDDVSNSRIEPIYIRAEPSRTAYRLSVSR